MIRRIAPGLYQLSHGMSAVIRADGWHVTGSRGQRLAGPFDDVLAAAHGATLVTLAVRERRATVRDRTVTSPHAGGGILVQVRLPDSDELARTTATVRKVRDVGPFRWHVSNHVTGDSPLFIAAVIAAAHEIDECEAKNVYV